MAHAPPAGQRTRRWTQPAFDDNVAVLAMTLARTLIGLAVLLFGRQLFWLFVGAVGFMLAMAVATQFLAGQPQWQMVALGLAAGVLGAFCALALERFAIAVAGFLAGAGIVLRVAYMTGAAAGGLVWVAALAGGIVGALVVAWLFDWALIVLSSAVGAALVADGIQPHAIHPVLLFAALAVVGIIAQARHLRLARQIRPRP